MNFDNWYLIIYQELDETIFYPIITVLYNFIAQ